MIDKIKANTNIVDVVSRYTELRGKGNCLQAKTNPLRDEKTPSFSVYVDTQKWQDFGSGEHGDVIDFIKLAERLDTKGAIDVLSSWYGIDTNGFVPTVSLPPAVVVKPVRKEKLDVSMYQQNEKYKTFKHLPYKAEALAIAPLFVYKEASRMALKRFHELTAWDSIHNTLVLLIEDYDGLVFSSKHRRKNSIKWCTATGTSPNSQCLINITAPSVNPIFIVEGHHDYLTAVLLSYDEVESFNVLMVPTIGYKAFTPYEVDLLRGKDVYFLPDLKRGDRAGVEAMRTLVKQLDGVARNTRMTNLHSFLTGWDIEVTGDKLDLSEAVELWTGTARGFTNALQYYCDETINYIGDIF